MTDEEKEIAMIQSVERFSWAWQRIAVALERLAGVAESLNKTDQTVNK